MEGLTETERAKLVAEFEYISELFARRHGVTLGELAEATRWVKTHREYVEAMRRGATLAVLGFLASAMLLAFWEGVKSYLRSDR